MPFPIVGNRLCSRFLVANKVLYFTVVANQVCSISLVANKVFSCLLATNQVISHPMRFPIAANQVPFASDQ